jgi:hypothetical protein
MKAANTPNPISSLGVLASWRPSLLLLIVTLVACGARTELFAPEEVDASDASASPDVKRRDAAEEDALPPIEEFQPDAPVPTDCPDAGATLVYLISSENELFSFYPPTLAFSKIGDIACPDTTQGTPWSMAVDRLGTAYSVFSDGFSGKSARLMRRASRRLTCRPQRTRRSSSSGWVSWAIKSASRSTSPTRASTWPRRGSGRSTR